MNERIKSTVVENVISTLGTNSKKPNTVVMAIHEDFIIDALKLYQIQKRGEKPTEGLIGLELHAVYAEDEEKEIDRKIIDIDDALNLVVDEGDEE